jgi:hypothetical protein
VNLGEAGDWAFGVVFLPLFEDDAEEDGARSSECGRMICSKKSKGQDTQGRLDQSSFCWAPQV